MSGGLIQTIDDIKAKFEYYLSLSLFWWEIWVWYVKNSSDFSRVSRECLAKCKILLGFSKMESFTPVGIPFS
jgi:hypothetical protein